MSSPSGSPWAILAGASLAACLPTLALAQQAPPFPILLNQVQAGSPRAALSAAEVAQAEGLARQAGARPNPTLDVTVENFAGSGALGGFAEAETTLGLSQTLELGGKRRARVSAGAAGIAAAEAKGRLARADFIHDLALAYAEAEAAAGRVTLAREAADLAVEDLRVADVLVQAGRESELRAVQARAALDAAQAEAAEAASEQALALAKLSALAGAPYTSVAGGLLAHLDRRHVFSAPDPMASVERQALTAEREAAAMRLRVEQSRARPDATVSLGVRRLEGADATALTGGFSIPLGVNDRNQGAIAAAQAEVRIADARLAQFRIAGDIEGRAAAVKTDAAQARLAAQQRSEAAALEAYRLTRLGYDGGKAPLSELLAARQALVAARRQTLATRLDGLTAEADLARLSGATPFGDVP